ncbi:hypothetical protein [Aureimonas sp. D3]|uniref:hypothetical protein n=1 Tax=Aureimonas sp. D3 TaxID=1638164 RepID=UPI0007866C52|nr:hypothetical protein [Aureimonas sp. D3]
MQGWTLKWDRGRAVVTPAGAMLHHLTFDLGSGRSATPFAEAAWHDEPEIQGDETLAQHLRLLGGEWACVPFGTTGFDPGHHGYGSNAEWELVEDGEGTLHLACAFPSGHPVERLERRIRGVPGKAAVEFSLRVVTRIDCALPIGLHPIFKLPETTGTLHLEPAPFERGQVFPEPFQPGVSRLRTGALFSRLDAVDTLDGEPVSLAALPAPGLFEELVQLWKLEGSIALRDETAGTRVRFEWDKGAFPHCLLWISQAGRTAKPWNGRFRGLGIEPVASAFDRTDLLDGSFSREGVSQTFRAGEPWDTRYRISAEVLASA